MVEQQCQRCEVEIVILFAQEFSRSPYATLLVILGTYPCDKGFLFRIPSMVEIDLNQLGNFILPTRDVFTRCERLVYRATVTVNLLRALTSAI